GMLCAVPLVAHPVLTFAVRDAARRVNLKHSMLSPITEMESRLRTTFPTVDVTWNPAWRGTEQVRHFVLLGDRLTVTSMWQPSLNLEGSPMTRGILVFERVK
ncbi:MAG TPA: lipocalin-like domain-containing protein, partial [Steroidobacteraceae bacterium]|nr:lipocalin-like domain-containing protein [Steroidobacteraceae bacterium]